MANFPVSWFAKIGDKLKMSKLRKATKKITAVAAATAMVASAAFGASLGSYPSNFVKNDKFNGQIVVGSAADAMDSTNAQAIIADLAKEFSGESSKVKISYKKAGTGGEELNAVRSNNELNYGETLGSVTESAGFDDSDSDKLEDGKFSNGVSDEDYEQTLTLAGGEFNYALKDEVNGVDEIKEGIFYADGETFATYKLDLKTEVSLASLDDADFIGETLTIMGNEFTIGAITASGGNLAKLELLGGANKISLGEGETTTVTVEGKSYEISVDSVSSSKVLLSVNGQSKSISEYDSEKISGVNLAVTDLVESSRDSVKGYAEIVVGGQKITLEDGDKLVKINEEDMDNIYENYEVTSDFTGSNFDAIVLTYKVSDDTLLEAGDSLEDVLFQAFTLNFEGTNEPDYTTVELKVNDDDIEISGTTEDGQDLKLPLLHMGDKTAAASAVWLAGKGDEDRMISSASLDLTGGVGATALNYIDGTLPSLNLTSTNVKGMRFLLEKDNEEQYLYELTSVDTSGSDHEVDFDEMLRGDDESDIKATEWNTKLGKTGTFAVNTSATNFTLNQALFGDTIAFENNLLVELANAEAVAINAGGGSTIDIALDVADTDGDTSTDDDQVIRLTFNRDSTDSEFDIATPTLQSGTVTVFDNAGEVDNEDGNSDVQTYVTRYGTKVVYDNDEKRSVKIMTPDEQVRADVTLVFGGAAAETMYTTVDADMVESTKADLKADGYSIVGTEDVASTKVQFDVKAVTLDTEVSGMDNMIVVGGPAVNAVARELMGIEAYTIDQAGVAMGEGIVKYFADANSVLVYGYSAADTTAAVAELNNGGLSGNEKKVN